MIDDILAQIQKPGRYIGNEWNVSRKDFARAYIKFALCFPDLYEVGMSNLGMRIIYGILNNIGDVCCERFFSPAPDMEESLRRNKTGILSLESKMGLDKFDIAGFSLAYELSYINALSILDLASLPLKSEERDYRHPLVIAGGPCMANPEPVCDFFDIFVIGEAEDSIIELIDIYRGMKEEYKTGRMSKQDLLWEFAKIEGIYIPSFYDVRYGLTGKIEEFKPKRAGAPLKIKKRIVKDLDKAYFPVSWTVPFIQIIHDRITLEIMRGCPNRCRFCQARQLYFPFRKRSPDNLLKLADESLRSSGYEEIALSGLSVSDYPGIEKLAEMFINTFKERCVSISLPSIKPRDVVAGLSSSIAAFKKTSLTFAPEAASERLRSILGKNFDLGNFSETVKHLQPLGYKHIKLYFMIGLPTETESDLDAIADFCLSVSDLGRESGGRPIQLNISINTLIPKPHTAFQWFAMEHPEKVKYKQNYLKQRFSRYKKMKLSFHDVQLSYLEALLSRGDRRLSRVILDVFKRGAKFDAWEEHFDFEKWQAAFKESGIDPEFYLREKDKSDLLPWGFLDLGAACEPQ